MTPPQPSQHIKPADRPPHFDDDDLTGSWQYSAQLLKLLSDQLKSAQLSEEVCCVGVSGSLARMEAHPGSDLDLLIAVNDLTPESDRLWDNVWCAIESHPGLNHLRRPKSDGIFSVCVSVKATLDRNVRGLISENVNTYGHRMQLLLDSQPVLHDSAFRDLQADILDWASEHQVANEFQTDCFHWFRHEIHRYWHSIAARATYLNDDRPAANRMTNVKLRSTRRMLIAAALAMLSGRHSIREIVDHQLALTPVERVLLDCHNDVELLNAYSRILSYLAAADFSQPISPDAVQWLQTIEARLHQFTE